MTVILLVAQFWKCQLLSKGGLFCFVTLMYCNTNIDNDPDELRHKLFQDHKIITVICNEFCQKRDVKIVYFELYFANMEKNSLWWRNVERTVHWKMARVKKFNWNL
jgi:hypothetical protein